METPRPILVPLEPFPQKTITVSGVSGLAETAQVEFTEHHVLVLTPGWFVPSDRWLEEFKKQGGHEQILHLLANPPWKFLPNPPDYEPSNYSNYIPDGKTLSLGDPVIKWVGGDEWGDRDYWVLSVHGPGRMHLDWARWNDPTAMQRLVSMINDPEYLNIMVALEYPELALELVALQKAEQLNSDRLLPSSDMDSVFRVLKSHRLLPRWSRDKHHGLLKSFLLRCNEVKFPISIEISSPDIPRFAKRTLAKETRKAHKVGQIPLAAIRKEQAEWIRRAREGFTQTPGWYIVDNPTWREGSAGASGKRRTTDLGFSVTRVEPERWETIASIHRKGPRLDVSGVWFEES